MADKVYVVGKHEVKTFRDDKGVIGTFRDGKDDVVRVSGKLERSDDFPRNYYFVTSDEKIQKRIEALHEYKIGIIGEASKMPNMGAVNLRHSIGINPAKESQLRTEAKEQARREVQDELARLQAENLRLAQEQEQNAKDSQEFAELSAEVTKAGGEIMMHADPEKVKRYKELKKKLGVKELVPEPTE